VARIKQKGYTAYLLAGEQLFCVQVKDITLDLRQQVLFLHRSG